MADVPVKERVRVAAEELRWSCPERCLQFETTEGVVPIEGTIGQDRALRALRVGLELYSPGYNVFVSGLVGTGRTTTVKELLEEISPRCAVPQDRVYVMNFADSDRPSLLSFPPGKAMVFRREMEEFVENLKRRLPSLFDDKEFTERRDAIVKRYGEKEQEILGEFQAKLQEEGLALVTVQAGPVPRPDIFPVVDGKPVPPPQFEEMVESGAVPQERLDRVKSMIEEFRAELRDHLRRGRDLAREMAHEIEKLNREIGATVMEGDLEDLRERFEFHQGVLAWLGAVAEDVLEHLDVLTNSEDGQTPSEAAEQFFGRYTVNVISDHSQMTGCPVVVAQNPTYTSLLGTIEREMVGPGVWRTDHTMIKGGAILDADGGYLILNVLDVLIQPGVWPVLMRALKSRQLEIALPELPFLGMTTGLKPEPIDLNVKVILIGEPRLYHLLYSHDPDFRKIFKIRADFSPDMDLREENLGHYVKVIARICEKEGLRSVSSDAMGRLAEVGVRAAGRQDKISTRFADVADVVREADYWAGEEGEKVIGRAHVNQAIAERRYRDSALDSRIREMMQKDILIIRTEGKEVGQVNGLSVMDLGFYAMGKPTLITASTAVGRSGIINIEREARLSGGIYDKGVLIISGYLRRLFARTRPLALTASLCFEQSYAGVDGDSASIAEIFALLSDLSGIPLDQGIAVTGSVNQRGQIQPIGGVNEKVEGFFRLCEARGLTGGQGCIIPRRNVGDLMLHEDVVAAVREGTFHVFAVSSVEEGIEILTGIPAGARGEDGEYPEGTVFRAVDDQLGEYLEALRGKGDDDDWKPLRPVTAAEPPPTAPDPDPGLPTPPTAGGEEDG